MSIKATLESPDGSPYDGIEFIEPFHYGFWADATAAGRIILARCLENNGADIYIASGRYKGNIMSVEDGYDLMARADVHEKVLPWMSIDIPIRLPEGGPANLNLLSQPTVRLIKNPLFTPLEEE